MIVCAVLLQVVVVVASGVAAAVVAATVVVATAAVAATTAVVAATVAAAVSLHKDSMHNACKNQGYRPWFAEVYYSEALSLLWYRMRPRTPKRPSRPDANASLHSMCRVVIIQS
jgi:hypothetical protein